MMLFFFVARGKFIVIDGLDGVGKGVIESAILNFEKDRGRRIFDSVSWCKKNLGSRPDLSLVKEGRCSVVFSAEPTYSCLGRDIKHELISNKHNRTYPSESLIQAYALDREIQMKVLVVPSLSFGCTVIQSRSMVVSCCYQLLNSVDEGKDPRKILDYILGHPGNRFQLMNPPDLLIIPTIGNVEELIARLNKRDKKDNAIFENIAFQRRAKSVFESDWLREIFENAGSKIAYLDAGISIESTKEQAIEIYKSFCSSGEVPEKYRQVPAP